MQERERSEEGATLLQIGEVSRALGVSPQMLRVWEKEGLVRPVRSAGGTRYYRGGDLERLRRIRRLRSEHGLNFAAIRREIGPAGEDGGSHDGRALRSVGERLRALRLQQKKTLKEVASATGLSVSFLSTLERGGTGASIASLRAITEAYGLGWREIFDSELARRSPHVKPRQRAVSEWPNGVRFEDLTANGTMLDPAVVALPPHAGSGGPFSHAGEEFIYVLSGVLFVRLDGDGETYRLEPHDSMHFPSTTSHHWWTEEEPAEVVYVNTPPSF